MNKMRNVVLVCFFLFSVAAHAQRFPPPIWDDDDRQTIPEPRVRDVADWYDFLLGTFGEPTLRLFDLPRHFRGMAGKPKEAENINAFDEAPNSSWFTNRNFFRPIAPEEFAKGSNRTAGPDTSGPWQVINCKHDGVTPGVTISDARGDIYILKFDPPDYPELTSAADVIGSKVFYAAGYNVPENSVIFFTPADLQVAAGCLITDRFGKSAPLTQERLDEMLAEFPKTRDGKLRALASKFLSGKPKGPFSYSGWREDDPNDVIAHEHRRELRGLRVIAAFINHNDIRQINTLDMYVEENGRKFLKHHFIDFGATLGSASIFPNRPYEGLEYFFDTPEVLKRAFTLGLYPRTWDKGAKVTYPSLGYLETELFDPGVWKPNHPIASFVNMTNRDGYWGAKIVASFTDEQIEAAVRAGQLSNPGAERALIEVLKRRRERIGAYWFRRVSPLDRFRVIGRQLQFDDLAVEAGYDCSTCPAYHVRISGRNTQVLRPSEPLMLEDSKQRLRVQIQRVSAGWPQTTVEVFLELRDGELKITGIRR